MKRLKRHEFGTFGNSLPKKHLFGIKESVNLQIGRLQIKKVGKAQLNLKLSSQVINLPILNQKLGY